jgi:hypothetical protein
MHVGYADTSDTMVNGHSVSKETCNWTEKFFFHLLHVTMHSVQVLCGNITHLTHRELVLRNLVPSQEKNTDIS